MQCRACRTEASAGRHVKRPRMRCPHRVHVGAPDLHALVPGKPSNCAGQLITPATATIDQHEAAIPTQIGNDEPWHSATRTQVDHPLRSLGYPRQKLRRVGDAPIEFPRANRSNALRFGQYGPNRPADDLHVLLAVGARNHDSPIGLFALGASHDAVNIHQRIVNDFPVCGIHGLQHASLAAGQDIVRNLHRKASERILPLLPIVRDVYSQLGVMVTETTLAHHASEVLNRRQRVALRTNEHLHALAIKIEVNLLTINVRRHRPRQAGRGGQPGEERRCRSNHRCRINRVARLLTNGTSTPRRRFRALRRTLRSASSHGSIGWICLTLRLRTLLIVAVPSTTSRTTVSTFGLRSRRRRTHSSTNPRLPSHPAEQARLGFFEHLKLGVFLSNAQLIQRLILRRLD